MKKMVVILLAGILLYFLVGKKPTELTEASVREFIDKADDAARKRWPGEICAMRSKDFILTATVDEENGYGRPPIRMDKMTFCRANSRLPLIHNYSLTRESLSIQLASDRKSAVVKARYKERTPDYEGAKPVEIGKKPDDYDIIQEVISDDVSVVVLEDGELRFRSTDAHSVYSRHAREK